MMEQALSVRFKNKTRMQFHIFNLVFVLMWGPDCLSILSAVVYAELSLVSFIYFYFLFF